MARVVRGQEIVLSFGDLGVRCAASGDYAPDIMQDLKARAIEAMGALVSMDVGELDGASFDGVEVTIDDGDTE